MARRKKSKGGGGGGESWLITFSDLMTLLLTFFVLLLSMATMDRPMLTQISAFSSNIASIDHSGRGKQPERIQLLMEILREPHSILEKQDRIKDLLFPHDILPVDMSPGTLQENLRVLAHSDGIVIVLTEGILFAKGEFRLSRAGFQLLSSLTPFLHYSNADVIISGHTDTTPLPETDPYVLSGKRAMTALEHFLHEGMGPERFSVAGYGPDRPLGAAKTPANDARNRRIELLVKTQKRVGSYQ